MTSRYRFEGFELDVVSRVLSTDGVALRLSSRQIDLLCVLVAHGGALVTKDELLSRVWPGQEVEENNAAVHVSALRRVLGRGAIETVAGHGYRFAWRLQADPPPLAKVVLPTGPVPRELPSAPAMLHGRADDLQALSLRLNQHRFVTVVGAPGLGKSALALACAHQRKRLTRDGVIWVDLARDEEPLTVVATVAVALGLDPGTDLAGVLGTLRPLEVLLVIDNAEVAATPVAAFCHAVLEGTEQVALLATSRKVLRVPGERLYRPPPLSVPDHDCNGYEALGHGAVALFVDQVRAQDQRFVLDLRSAAQVIGLCRRLDGVPLAIQLAAGRLPLFGIDQLGDRLNDRFRLLTRGTQAGPQRHRSLRASMDLSHDLLNANERVLLRRLGVFEGGFTLDMATSIVADRGLDPWSVADALEGLVDHSLVVVDVGEQPRYRLMEDTRAYALLLLEENDESDRARQLHADTLCRLFERATRALAMMPDARWLAEFGLELANVRSALDWCLAHDPATGIGLLAGSSDLFELLALTAEARWRHAAYECEVPPDLPPGVLARFCVDHGHLLATVDPLHSAAWFRRGVAACRSTHDAEQLYLVLCRRVVEDRALSLQEMRAVVDEIEELEHEDWTSRVRLWGLSARAHLWHREGRLDDACEALRVSMQVAIEIGASGWLLGNLLKLMTILLSHGQHTQAGSLARELACGATGSHRRQALGCLAVALLAEGRTGEARETLAEFIDVSRAFGWEGFDRMVPACAWLASAEGRHDDAARLAGYARRMAPARGEWGAAWRTLVATLKSSVDPQRLARLQAEGGRWREEEAGRAALAG